MQGEGIVCFIFCFGSITSSPPLAAQRVYNSTPFVNGFEEVVPVTGFNGRRRNGNGFSTDTFCREYRRIVLTRQDLASIRAASRSVRNRIQANDLNYLCRCEGFRSPLCFTNGG